jgi:hypothetical protein
MKEVAVWSNNGVRATHFTVFDDFVRAIRGQAPNRKRIE